MAAIEHMVPRFLLPRFASPGTEQLFAYDKRTDRVFRSSIRRLARERDFYSRAGDGGELERRLSRLEADTAPIVARIIAEGSLSLGSKNVSTLALFAAVQHLRTARVRASLREIDRQFQGWLEQDGHDVAAITNYHPMGAGDEDMVALDLLRDAGRFAPHFLDKAWLLFDADRAGLFYVSDNPVVLSNEIERPHRGNLGLGIKGIEIYLPLSSRYVLAMVCPSWANAIASQHSRM